MTKAHAIILLAWTAAILLPGCATSPPVHVDVDQLAADYYALRPTSAIRTNLTMDQALQAQAALVRKMEERAGTVVGYKVGLVTQEAQKRYNVDAPVRGVLFQKMMLENGADLPAQFGVNPLCEADLMVVVKDKGINGARNVQEVVAHLQEVVAFIELPDSYLATNQPVTGAMLTAANVGARYGVMGQRVTVHPTPEFARALAEMKVTLTDQDGRVLLLTQGKTILDHPLHSVLWLKEELNRQGIKLRKGDLISLGGFNMLTPQAGQALTLTYDGIPSGPIQATVRFH